MLINLRTQAAKMQVFMWTICEHGLIPGQNKCRKILGLLGPEMKS